MKLTLNNLAKAISAIAKAIIAMATLVRRLGGLIRSLGGVIDSGAYALAMLGMCLTTALCWHLLDLLARG